MKYNIVAFIHIYKIHYYIRFYCSLLGLIIHTYINLDF